MHLSWVRRSNRPSRTSGSVVSRKRARPQLEELEDRRVPASAATNAYVNAVYGAVLHRPADAQGLAFWGNLIDSGQQTPQQVALGIQTSQEGENALISSLYLQILGRTADPAGLAYWRGVFETNNQNDQKGGTGDGNFDDPDDFNFDGVTAVRVGLFASPEFLNNAGGTANGFVTQLYVVGLGRQPDPTGFAGFLAGLNVTDTTSRMTAAFILVTSLEAIINEVEGFYINILGRPGEQAGVNGWVAGIQGGNNNTVTTSSSFLGSPEFMSDASSNSPNFAPNVVYSTQPPSPVPPPGPNPTPQGTPVSAPDCTQGEWTNANVEGPNEPETVHASIHGSSVGITLNGDLHGSGTATVVSATTESFVAKASGNVTDSSGNVVATGITLHGECSNNDTELVLVLHDQNDQLIVLNGQPTAFVFNLVKA